MLPILPLLLAACAPVVQPQDRVDDTCDVIVQSTLPANLQQDAYYRTPIEFVLSEPDPTARVVTELPGVHYVRDGVVVGFRPTEPLDPDTDYRFGLDYCHGVPEIDFHTSEVGSPLAVPESELVDYTWSLDLASAEFVRGATLGAFVASLWDDELLIGVTDANEFHLDLRLALVDDGEQDLCERTVDLPDASFDAPWFEYLAEEVWLGIRGDLGVDLRGVAIDGTFSPDASWVQGVRVQGWLDVRGLAKSLGEEPDDWCAVAASAGEPCEPCPNGSPTCVRVEARGADAWRTELPAVTSVDEACAITLP